MQTTTKTEQRLGNGFVRYVFHDGGHYDVAEDRFSEMELRLIEAETFREAGGPSNNAEGQAAAFVVRYDGKKFGWEG